MRIAIRIPQVRCRKVTHPRTNADEIYLAYAVGLGKPGSGTSEGKAAFVGGRVSAVKTGLRKGTVWNPESGLHAVVDVGDAEVAFISIALYERDDGKIHEKLTRDLAGILSPPKFDWKAVSLPDDVTSFGGWMKSIWKSLIAVFRHLLQDDYLGRQDIVVTDDDDGDDWKGSREFRFKRFGGDYRVTVVLDEA